MYRILFIFLLFALPGYSQYKSYKIGVKGDTLNIVDNAGLKQGRWVITVPPLRGEPGYDEEGYYKDDKKEGVWRKYSSMGDLQAIENYKYGFKNGKSSYYTVYGIIREENWKAVNPDNPYDTVDVPDLNTDAVYKRIVKVEGTNYRHGTWTFYDPQTGMVSKTEEYILDKLVSTKKNGAYVLSDSLKYVRDTSKAIAKPKEVLDYEKKNKKKKIRVRDGATGVQ